MPLVEFTRRNVIGRAQEAELFVVATNSDGNLDRRRELLTALGTGATEEVLDPGIDVVTQRFSRDDRLSGAMRKCNIPLVRAAAVMECGLIFAIGVIVGGLAMLMTHDKLR